MKFGSEKLWKEKEKVLILLSGYKKYAAVAQLEERIPAKDEVTGSIPVGCTIA